MKREEWILSFFHLLTLARLGELVLAEEIRELLILPHSAGYMDFTAEFA